MVVLYGIINCDSVRRARGWLDSFSVQYEFHDFRKNGIESSKVKKWIALLGWESLINRRSSSWKSLDSSVKIEINDDSAVDIILEKPTLIKRPVAEFKEAVLIGFKPLIYEEYFLEHEKKKTYE